MTFELVRIGWPNTAAILALALIPILALTVSPAPKSEAAQTAAAESLDTCQPPDGPSWRVASAAPLTVLE